jgi:hypothetical protein
MTDELKAACESAGLKFISIENPTPEAFILTYSLNGHTVHHTWLGMPSEEYAIAEITDWLNGVDSEKLVS